MSAQPEALRLAAELEDEHYPWPRFPAAAELRRLAAVEAQRDALLEALKLARLMLIAHGEKHAKFDAAIAKAEEKT